MTPKIEINSISVSKSSNEQNTFVKYDIEAAVDEIENSDTLLKLKYGFTLLSNPKNTRISVNGFASIFTNPSEASQYLNQDENNIPRVVNVIYQELFPLFYLISKSMQIPCPAYKLSHISAPAQSEAAASAQINEQPQPELTQDNNVTNEVSTLDSELQTDVQTNEEAPQVQEKTT
jgi:hypothetical protein